MLKNIYSLSFVVAFAFVAIATVDVKINNHGNFDFGAKKVLADDGGGGDGSGGDGSGGDGGCCGDSGGAPTGSDSSGAGVSEGGASGNSAGGYEYVPPPVYSCTNGATNYPTCTFPQPTCSNGYTNYPTCGPTQCTNGATNFPSCNNNVCTNGATNYPSCNNNVCTNGATNYPSCNNVCTNGYTNYPTCGPTQCTNGATNFPSCNNNVCTNGATNYPSCNNNVCTNGATNYPSCNNVCTNGYTNYPTCGPTQCTNGASNFPTCTFPQQYCSNGATNYPYCNNQYIPPTITYVWCDGIQYIAPHACYQRPIPRYSFVVTKDATAIGYTYAQLNGAYIQENTNNSRCVAFFDYGPNGNLSKRSAGQTLYPNYKTNFFSQAVYGLTPNTIYSYRAGVSCLDGTKFGNIYQFKTPGYVYHYVAKKKVVKYVHYVKPVTVVSKTPTCNCEAIVYMTLDVQNLESEATIGKYANYRIIFKNTSSSTLENVVIRVTLPEELSVYSSDRGQFTKDGKTVTFTTPFLQAGEVGGFIITTSVGNNLQVGRQIIVNGYGNYTVSNTLKKGLPLKGEVTGYVVSIAGNGSGNGSGLVPNDTTNTVTKNSSNWWPTNLLDWLILLAVIAIFIAVLRYLFSAFQRSGTRA